MKAILPILIMIHGLIHVTGFAKAARPALVPQLKQPVSLMNGFLWLAAAILWIVAALLLFLKNESWWIPSIPAVILSQYLIITNWQDARFGTLANGIIVMAIIAGYAGWHFRGEYRHEVKAGLAQTASVPGSLLTDADLTHLPAPVQKYLHCTGAVGRPKVNNFRIAFTGRIRRDARSEWMPLTSVQYNFVDATARLFFMNASMMHLPVTGFHCFKYGKAFMDIRLLSLVKVQYQAGKEMDIAETVTFFNDMCCMAPATLIDKRINWLEVDSNRVKAAFTSNGITVTAWLFFNDQGQLVNFVSDDRFAAGEDHTMRRLRWSTPLKDYKPIHGYMLAGYADAIYSYQQGDLCYGNFRLTDIEYNCRSFR